MANFFRNYIFKNVSYKLVSLLIAVMLWWGVGRDQRSIEMPLTVPLEFQNPPSHLQFNSNYPFEAHITLRGPERVLEELSPSEVHAVVDLQGAGPGERTYSVSRSNIRVPRDVNVVQIVPSQFHISFDRTTVRSVPVQPRVIGTLLSGYGISGVSSDPATVNIVGPERRVEAVQAAITDPVDATGVVGRATFTTHAYVGDSLVRVESPETIRVTVDTSKTTGSAGKQ